MSTTRPAASDFDADTDDVEHVRYEVEWDAPDIPLATIPCIDRLLEYCDALRAVAESELDGMAEDARQPIVTLVGEMRSYIEGVMASEIDEVCDFSH